MIYPLCSWQVELNQKCACLHVSTFDLAFDLAPVLPCGRRLLLPALNHKNDFTLYTVHLDKSKRYCCQ